MRDIRRVLLVASGVLALAAAVVFLVLPVAAEAFWPWELSRLSRIFLASILAASAVPVIWIGFSGELAAVAAGAFNLAVTNAGMAVYLLVVGPEQPNAGVFPLAIGCVVMTAILAMLFLWGSRQPFRDSRPTPVPIRAAFVVFVCLLVAVGGALTVGRHNTFPWPLARDTSVMFGFIYLGAATYFAHGLVRPVWGNTKGQLLGFLAYDIVLIPPFLMHFAKVKPAMLPSLIVYTTVLFASAFIAIHYLFLHRATRIGSSKQPPVARID